MTTENASPSITRDPADNDSLAGAIRFAFSKLMESIDGVTIATVVEFQAGPPDYVRVQPQVQLVNTNGKAEPRGQVAQVPVCQIGAGGYILRFNLTSGDTGLLITCDRDISLYMQTGNQSPPNTNRKKDYSSSFFLPIVLRGYTVAGEDQENAVLQNLDGSVRLSLFSNKIKITGGLEVDDLVVTGDTTINGRAIIYGNLNTGADITAAGTITQGVPIPP